MSLNDKQTEILLRPIEKSRVKELDGLSHLEAWDVRAHLIRIFGFGGFSVETERMEMLYDVETTTRAGKPARKVAYRASVRLTIPDAAYVEWAVGESIMPDFKHGDAHDMAIKTAESQALKRAATNLGTQFGLSLYDNGSTADVVRWVLDQKPSTVNEIDHESTLISMIATANSIDDLRQCWRYANENELQHYHDQITEMLANLDTSELQKQEA
jgi:hypothetical protein